jgi:hypothetical protein
MEVSMEYTIEITDHTVEELLDNPDTLERIVRQAVNGFKASLERPENVVEQLTCRSGVAVFRAYQADCFRPHPYQRIK